MPDSRSASKYAATTVNKTVHGLPKSEYDLTMTRANHPISPKNTR